MQRIIRGYYKGDGSSVKPEHRNIYWAEYFRKGEGSIGSHSMPSVSIAKSNAGVLVHTKDEIRRQADAFILWKKAGDSWDHHGFYIPSKSGNGHGWSKVQEDEFLELMEEDSMEDTNTIEQAENPLENEAWVLEKAWEALASASSYLEKARRVSISMEVEEIKNKVYLDIDATQKQIHTPDLPYGGNDE